MLAKTEASFSLAQEVTNSSGSDFIFPDGLLVGELLLAGGEFRDQQSIGAASQLGGAGHDFGRVAQREVLSAPMISVVRASRSNRSSPVSTESDRRSLFLFRSLMSWHSGSCVGSQERLTTI